MGCSARAVNAHLGVVLGTKRGPSNGI